MSAKITTTIPRLDRGPGWIGRHGQSKHWAKQITRLDPSKTNGYAFIGEWLDMDRSVELPVGAVVLAFDGVNTKTDFAATIRVLQATERGMAVLHHEPSRDRGWALAVRELIAPLLGDVEPLYKVILTGDAIDCLRTMLRGETLAGLVRDPDAALDVALQALDRAEAIA